MHQFDQGKLWLLKAVPGPVWTFADCVYSCFEKAELLELMKRKVSMSRNKDLQRALNIQSDNRVFERRVFFPTLNFRNNNNNIKKKLEVM